MAPWPEGKGIVSDYKIYYLKICKAVVGWEVIMMKDGKNKDNKRMIKKREVCI